MIFYMSFLHEICTCGGEKSYLTAAPLRDPLIAPELAFFSLSGCGQWFSSFFLFLFFFLLSFFHFHILSRSSCCSARHILRSNRFKKGQTFAQHAWLRRRVRVVVWFQRWHEGFGLDRKLRPNYGTRTRWKLLLDYQPAQRVNGLAYKIAGIRRNAVPAVWTAECDGWRGCCTCREMLLLL